MSTGLEYQTTFVKYRLTHWNFQLLGAAGLGLGKSAKFQTLKVCTKGDTKKRNPKKQIRFWKLYNAKNIVIDSKLIIKAIRI